jgi:hypothetical protein
MSEPSRLDSYFAPMLGAADLERFGLLPDDARELIEIARDQDRVIRHLAAVIRPIVKARTGPARGPDGPRASNSSVDHPREKYDLANRGLS